MVFKITTTFQHVLTASTISAPSNALIVFGQPSVVRRASYNVTSTCRYTASRYVRGIFCGPLLTTLKVWQDGFYQRASLLRLGLSFYLGHHHTPCPATSSFQKILVIDLNGTHYVNVQFCECEEAPVEHYCQLLRMGWYPASFDRPTTAFAFDLLNTYHKLTLQGKLNLYDFYSSIMQKADNCGRNKTLVNFAITN